MPWGGQVQTPFGIPLRDAVLLLHCLQQMKMGTPTGPLPGPGPCRDNLGIDGHLMQYGEQGDGGEFFEQVDVTRLG